MPSSLVSLRLVLSLLLPALLIGCAASPDITQTDSTRYTLAAERYGHAAVADNDNIYVIGGANGETVLSTIEIIDPETRETTVLRDKVTPRAYLTAVWDGKESIYIFSGTSKHSKGIWTEKTVEVFNTRTHEVTTTTSMPMPRRISSSVLLDDKIIVTGGSIFSPNEDDGGYHLRSTPLVTALDLNTQKWHRLADLPVPRDTRTFTYDNKVCALGGYDHKVQWSSFECYNPNTNAWQVLSDAPKPVSAHSIAVHNDKVYVFGDYDELDRVMMYDFSSNTWSEPDLPYVPSRHNAAVVFGDEVFVIGGNTGTTGPSLDYIQVFNLVGE
ncbi:Kelch repeat-containing protein [Aliidiomarina sp. Khilg15.8]